MAGSIEKSGDEWGTDWSASGPPPTYTFTETALGSSQNTIRWRVMDHSRDPDDERVEVKAIELWVR